MISRESNSRARVDRRSIDLARVAVCGDAEPLFRMSREVAPDATRENAFAVVSRRRARAMARGRTLVIDNYDSYAVILSHLIARVEGAAPVVVRNDDVSVDAVRATLLGGDEGFARVVIGPGPGTPARASDVGAAVAILRAEGARADVPVFGVCVWDTKRWRRSPTGARRRKIPPGRCTDACAG